MLNDSLQIVKECLECLLGSHEGAARRKTRTQGFQVQRRFHARPLAVGKPKDPPEMGAIPVIHSINFDNIGKVCSCLNQITLGNVVFSHFGLNPGRQPLVFGDLSRINDRPTQLQVGIIEFLEGSLDVLVGNQELSFVRVARHFGFCVFVTAFGFDGRPRFPRAQQILWHILAPQRKFFKRRRMILCQLDQKEPGNFQNVAQLGCYSLVHLFRCFLLIRIGTFQILFGRATNVPRKLDHPGSSPRGSLVLITRIQLGNSTQDDRVHYLDKGLASAQQFDRVFHSK
mmetsp:Transcript_22352/g.55387  ORF Transcript_22352/g.55387 Transcript_22352/m.55387 type:complete len:285 (+) Transcript_22352:140-994(+)